MAAEFVDFAYKTGSGRYIQERGALERLGHEVARLGTKAFLIGGPHALAAAADGACASLEAVGVPYEKAVYKGRTSRNTAQRFARQALAGGCDVIVGIGGGRMMDLAKAVAENALRPVIEVPTSIATCAAFTPLSIMYTEEGAFDGTWRYEHEIDAVVVDVDVMANQPGRLVAAGIMDSLAKFYEITNGSPRFDEGSETIQRFCAYEYARVNRDILLRHGQDAYADVLAGRASDALDRVTFVNVALTGIVSSLTRGFHQTALAHKLYDGVRTVFTRECEGYLHGELVAIGLLMQVVYNGAHEEKGRLRGIMESMGMPCSIGELGISRDNPRLADLRAYVNTEEFVGADAASQQRFACAFDGIL